MSKASDAGKAFLAGVFAKLPESVRGQAEAAFAAAEAEVALEVVGTGALAQPEINRKLDELRTKEAELKAQADARLAELNSWYATNEAALKEYVELKKKTPPVDPDDPPAPVDARKVAMEVVDAAGREYVNVSAWIAAKAVEHLHRFGEPLPATELVAHPKLGRQIAGAPEGRVFSLEDAYTERYGERVAAKLKEADEKKFNDEVEKRLAERRKTEQQSNPFPLRGAPGPSVLDVLDTKDGPAAHTLDTAVAEYERLQATRGV